MRKVIWALTTLLVGLSSIAPTGAQDNTVRPGEAVPSPQQKYELVHQGDGNVVLQNGVGPTWHTKTHGNNTSRLVMQDDGNLVLYDAANQPLWHSGTNGYYGATLKVQDDGNVVIYDINGNVAWAIKHWPPRPPEFRYDCVKKDYPYNYGYTLEHFKPGDRAKACSVMLCESHVDPAADPATITNRQGSSASGLFQFLDSTWRNVAKYYAEAGKYARAMYAPPKVQGKAAAIWLSVTSWSQWNCA